MPLFPLFSDCWKDISFTKFLLLGKNQHCRGEWSAPNMDKGKTEGSAVYSVMLDCVCSIIDFVINTQNDGTIVVKTMREGSGP
jgi:hypothetical protein